MCCLVLDLQTYNLQNVVLIDTWWVNEFEIGD